MKPELNNIRYREEEMSINLMLFNELGKMCNLISSYDKIFFNTPASEIEIASFKQKNKLLFPSLTEKKNRIGKSNSEDFSKNLHFFSF